jgi:hypothetical protein
MVCARERRLLPYDRIEEEEDGVEGLRCCLNTGARAPFKVPAKTFFNCPVFSSEEVETHGPFWKFFGLFG